MRREQSRSEEEQVQVELLDKRDVRLPDLLMPSPQVYTRSIFLMPTGLLVRQAPPYLSHRFPPELHRST